MDTTRAYEPNARILTRRLAALTALTALSLNMSLPVMPQLQQAFGAGVSKGSGRRRGEDWSAVLVAAAGVIAGTC